MAGRRLEVDGRAATVGDVAGPAQAGYGHVTTMQVRAGRVRGLDLHLTRMADAQVELFGEPLDVERVRAAVRHAVGGADASVRVVVAPRHGAATATAVLVAVEPPPEAPAAPLALTAVPYQRPLPHLKHVGTFGQLYWARRARLAGFDDALLTGPAGEVLETSVANVALWDGERLVWPTGPQLVGTTWQLLERAEPTLVAVPSVPSSPGSVATTVAMTVPTGVPMTRRPVALADLHAYRAAVVVSSRGIGAVARIDDVTLDPDAAVVGRLRALYDAVTWDEI